jgi:hypothetical protein
MHSIAGGPITSPTRILEQQGERTMMKITVVELGLLTGCLLFAGATRTLAKEHVPASAQPTAGLERLSSDSAGANDSAKWQGAHEDGVPTKLVELVRAATKEFIDVNTATAAGYAPFLGCISGSDHGAMGIHYVNGALLNGEIDASHPQALIYEPSKGKMQLVGVEFIVDRVTWLANNPNPPVLEGQTFLLVDSPNRYNIPAFFELHVWAWRDNPQGAFVDWNNHVTCEGE